MILRYTIKIAEWEFLFYSKYYSFKGRSVDRHELIDLLINNVELNDADYVCVLHSSAEDLWIIFFQYGRAILQAASEIGDVQVALFLINAGIDVNKTFDVSRVLK